MTIVISRLTFICIEMESLYTYVKPIHVSNLLRDTNKICLIGKKCYFKMYMELDLKTLWTLRIIKIHVVCIVTLTSYQ